MIGANRRITATSEAAYSSSDPEVAAPAVRLPSSSTSVAAYLRLCAQILGLAMPMAMMIIVDKVVSQGAVNTLMVLALGVTLLTAFQYLFLWAHAWDTTVESGGDESSAVCSIPPWGRTWLPTDGRWLRVAWKMPG